MAAGRHFFLSVCLISIATMVSTSSFAACLSTAALSTLERGCHRQRPVYFLPTTRAFWEHCISVLPGFHCTTGSWGDTILFSLFLLYTSLLPSGYFTGTTTNAHQPRNLFPLPPFLPPGPLGFVRLDLYHT